MNITCDTHYTSKGVDVTHPSLGKIATITRKVSDVGGQPSMWDVMPYAFSPATHRREYHSLQGAEYFALSLAHEMAELGKGSPIQAV